MNRPAQSSWDRWAGIAAIIVAVLTFHRTVLFKSGYTFPWDFRSVHLPLATLMVDAFRERRWPLWNPYMYAGMPVFSNIQAASFYPPILISALVSAVTGIPIARVLEWELALHVIGAGLFTLWLLRALGLRPVAAATGGFVYSLGGFFAAHTEHLGAISGATWLPFAWLCVVRLRAGASRRWAAGLAFAICMATLAGLPQVSLVVLISSVILAIVLWSNSRRSRRDLTGFAYVFAALALGAAMAAIQLIPTIQMTSLSIAQYRSDYLGTGGGVWPRALVTLFLPNHLNAFDLEKYKGPGDVTFSYFYCGIFGIALAIIGAFRRRSVPFLILTLLSALWMVGDYFWLGRELFIHLPAKIRDGVHPEFATCAFMLGLSILSAMGADLAMRRNWIRYPLALLVCFDLILTSSNRVMNTASLAAEPGVTRNSFDGSRPLLDGVRELSWTSNPPWRVDVLDGSLLDWAVMAPITHIPSAHGHDPLALERIVQVRLAFAHGDRWGSSYPVETLDSHILDLINAKYVLSRRELSESELRGATLHLIARLPGHWVYENDSVLPRFFFAPRVRLVSTLDAAAARLKAPDFDPHQEAVVESTAAPDLPSVWSTGSVTVRSYSPQYIEVESISSGRAFLVVADAHYPGWKAYVDGRETPIFYTDAAFRGVIAPAGRHRIVMRFEPGILWPSGGLSAISWAVFFLGLSAGRSRKAESLSDSGKLSSTARYL